MDAPILKWCAGVLGMLMMLPGTSVAQSLPELEATAAFRSPLETISTPCEGADWASPGRSFALSLVLPGAGQYAQGRKRWMAYLAAEATGWFFWSRARSRAHDFEDRFRDLAWETARTWDGPRVEGDWDYYERMERFARSGAFDRDPDTPGVQPEEDPTTFNGDAWRLARQIHLGGGSVPEPGDAGYEAALDYYRERAVGPEFEWDWSGQESARMQYSELIGESDDAFADASLLLGAVVFNHVLSGLDAFLSARASRLSSARVGLRTGLEPPLTGTAPRLTLTARLAFQ